MPRTIHSKHQPNQARKPPHTDIMLNRQQAKTSHPMSRYPNWSQQNIKPLVPYCPKKPTCIQFQNRMKKKKRLQPTINSPKIIKGKIVCALLKSTINHILSYNAPYSKHSHKFYFLVNFSLGV